MIPKLHAVKQLAPRGEQNSRHTQIQFTDLAGEAAIATATATGSAKGPARTKSTAKTAATPSGSDRAKRPAIVKTK
jgi:hypothetical protein